jgi:TonB-dependent SusC/RagA subfamily outer membrane receptor
MMKKHLLWKNAVLALSMMLLSVGAFAQQHEIKGSVLDESQLPIPGANVVIKGTTTGTITNGNGEFTMNAADGDVLQVSYIGYTTEEVTVNGNGPYNVSLVPDLVGLDEVVVVGYGVQKKSNVTGAIASVKAEDLERRSSTSAVQAMQGKAAGVTVLNSSAAPGAGSDIRVRGYSSNSGNIGPLLIVDGLKVDNIQYLDPSMIESMEILKDAASAAIYGAEAGNGVVLITTKGGGKQDGKIFYNFQYSINKLGKRAELMNAEQYVNWNLEGGLFTVDELLDPQKYNYLGTVKKNDATGLYDVDGVDTNWADVIYGTGITQRHTFGAQGGNDRGSYYIAITHLDDNGIIKGDKDVYKRLSAQINADYKIKKWFSVSSNTSIEKWEKKTLGEHNEYGGASNVFLSSAIVDPITPVYYSDKYTMPQDFALYLEPYAIMGDEKTVYEAVDTLPGFYTAKTVKDTLGMGYKSMYGDENGYYAVSKVYAGDGINPLIARDRATGTQDGFNVRGTISADLKPFQGLVLTSRFGYRLWQNQSHNYTTPFFVNPHNESADYTLSASTSQGYYYQWENFANYNKSFDAHNIGAMVGMSYTEDHSFGVGGQLTGPDILTSYEDNFRYMQYYKADQDLCRRSITDGTPNQSANMSYFGRLSWNYADKYNVQVNFRADAFDSSKLSKDNRWGKFPSVSAGWTLSKEDFLIDVLSSATISYLKLRGSWGQNGNISVLRNYPYSVDVKLNSAKYQYNSSDNKISYGSYIDGLANPNLKWETSEQIDFGLDGRMLDDKISFAIDYYHKTTKDLLVEVAPPQETGVPSTTVNAGTVVNKGLEFELGWKDKVGDFTYSINANAATLKNEVTYIDKTVDRINGSSFANHKIYTTFEEGHSIWYFRGFEYAGVLSYEEASSMLDSKGEPRVNDAGKPLFRKADGDLTGECGNGELTATPIDSDMKDLGAGIPKFTYGITINMEYKNFDLTIFGTGIKGNKIWNCQYRTEHPTGNGLALFYEGRSIPTYETRKVNGKDKPFINALEVGKYPSAEYMKDNVEFYSSSANIFDGSYFKIKQIQLGYTIPRELTKKIAVESFRMFVALDDYFTFTKYKGFDPEVASNGTANSIGIDKGSYPTSKKVTFGLNLTF